MRKAWGLGAAFLSLALVLPARAQQPAGQPNANQFFTGVDPRKIKTPTVNPLGAMKSKDFGGALKPSAALGSTKLPSLNSFFPKMTLSTWPPRRPTFTANTLPVPKMSTAAKGKVNLFALPK